MISIKDYAKQNNVTYEAVRQQIKRYRDQLEDHIIRDGRTQYLDDVAVTFLDERRQKNPVVVYQQDKAETIKAMQQEIDRLLHKQEWLRDRIDDLEQYKTLAEGEKRALEDAKTAQERRQRELDQREADMTEEVRIAVQEAVEAAERDLKGKHTQEIQNVQSELQGQLDAAIKVFDREKKELEDQNYRQQQALAAKDDRIQELESRNLWYYLTDLFRKKDKK